MLFGKHINRYYIRYAPVLLIGLAALTLVDYMQLLMPELYRSVVNGLNTGEASLPDGSIVPFTMDFLLDRVCLPLILIILTLTFGRFIWRICFFGSGIRLETDLRRRMFDHCKDLSQPFYQKEKVGNLMALFINDLETVQDCFGSGIIMFCDATLLGVLAIAKMARMNLLLTGLSLIPMLLLVLIGTIVGKNMTKKWEARQEAFAALSDFSQENFSGLAVIKAFVKETHELMAFRRLNRKNEDANVEYTRISTLLNILVSLFVESVICVILGYGGYLVHEGVFNAGELIEFIGYFTAIIWPFMAIAQLIEMQSRGRASLNRIGELLDTEIEVTDRADVHPVENLTGNIELRHLTFRYPGAEYDALHDISLDIHAGESVGIIGKTGAGKTTLVDLLLRTYNIPDGMIFFDGHDVNDLPIHNIRDFAAYVPQDNFLFSDSVENNIVFAALDTDTLDDSIRADVETAARRADVHDNITEFSDGYQTVLGERGVTVSGGQKQRISIARALMKDAPVLILDDSVSAVDTKTERVILDNLAQTRQGKTTILIAHRITTIEHMDKIVFLEDGHLVAAGTHKELYASCPAYRNMVELQRLDEEKEAQA